MSKYQQRGAYHYAEFRKETPYRHHVIDLVSKVYKFVKPKGEILDVGCGEGLIMHKLRDIGFSCIGLEIDQIAIDLGREKGNSIFRGTMETVDVPSCGYFDAVLLCDVLEHMDNPTEVMALARSLAPVVVIAIPDRHDAHATQELDRSLIETEMDHEQWLMVHYSKRHARHLMIFSRD